MKLFVRNTLAATAFTIGTVGAAFGASPSLNDINATVTDLVWSDNVQAGIEGSTVTLKGYVDDDNIRTQIEAKIREIPGVSDVINEIETN